MRRISTAVLAAGLSFGFGQIVSAADMPAKAPVYKAPVAPVYSWTGFYIGGGVGTRSSVTDWTVTSAFNNPVVGAPVNIFGTCSAALPCANSEPLNDTAFRLSGYLGYNWQIAPQWVVGVEGDLGWAKSKPTLTSAYYPFFIVGGAGNGNDFFSVKTTWDASLRGRVGYLVTPSLLVYTTGGAAWLHMETTSNCSTIAFDVCSTTPLGGSNFLSPGLITHSKTALGWTVGGGLESMLWGNWLVRAEYRYADFGRLDMFDTRTCAAPCIFLLTSQTVASNVHVSTHTATFGLAYKFGDPVARAGTPGSLAPVYKTPPALAVSWAGPYLGAAVGARSSITNWSTTSLFNNPAVGAPVNLLAGCSALPCATSEPLNDTAFRFGGYLGYNWQIAPQWVVGVEGDLGWAKSKLTVTGGYYPFFVIGGPGNANDFFAVKTTWDASLRGRIGYLLTPSVLAYTTGGAAWLHMETTSSCDTAAGVGLCQPGNFLVPSVIAHSKTATGWTIGGGLETALWGNWLARGEYRYADFGRLSASDVRTCAAPCGFGGLASQTATYDVHVRTHTMTFGLAYKFGDSVL